MRLVGQACACGYLGVPLNRLCDQQLHGAELLDTWRAGPGELYANKGEFGSCPVSPPRSDFSPPQSSSYLGLLGIRQQPQSQKEMKKKAYLMSLWPKVQEAGRLPLDTNLHRRGHLQSSSVCTAAGRGHRAM